MFKYVRVKSDIKIPYGCWYYESAGEIFEVAAEKYVNPEFTGYLLSPYYIDSYTNYVHNANTWLAWQGDEDGFEHDYGILEECCEFVEMTRDEFIDWRIQFECQKIREKYGKGDVNNEHNN